MRCPFLFLCWRKPCLHRMKGVFPFEYTSAVEEFPPANPMFSYLFCPSINSPARVVLQNHLVLLKTCKHRYYSVLIAEFQVLKTLQRETPKHRDGNKKSCPVFPVSRITEYECKFVFIIPNCQCFSKQTKALLSSLNSSSFISMLKNKFTF